jgi:hypothetical protein
MNRPPDIEVIFPGPNGEQEKEPLLFRAPPEMPQQIYEDDCWDEPTAISAFLSAIAEQNGQKREAAMRAFDRLNCWIAAFRHLSDLEVPDAAFRANFHSMYVADGFRIGEALKGDLILVDALRHIMPPYSGPDMKLYRGELAARHEQHVCGTEWTSSVDVAEMFARRRVIGSEGDAVLLEIDAAAQAIIAAPNAHSHRLQEHGYLVDPRLIGDVRVLKRYP